MDEENEVMTEDTGAAPPGEPMQETANGLDAILIKFDPQADLLTPEGKLASAEKVLKAMEPIYDKAYDVALTSPEAASFLNDLLETGDVAKSLARNYDPEELKIIWDEIGNSDLEEDKKMYSEKTNSIKQRSEMVAANMELSMTDISEFMEEKKDWTPEKAQEFEDFVIQHYQDGADGKITKKDLALLEKGFKFDDAVAEAEDIGKVIGRNENIVAVKATKAEKDALLPELNAGVVMKPKDNKPKTFAQKFTDGVI